MNRLKLIAGLVLLPVLLAGFQARDVYAQGLNVDFDYATFRYDSSLSYMEIHYGFDLSRMKLEKQDSVYADTLLFHVIMRKTGIDTAGYLDSWTVPVAAPDTAKDEVRRTFVGQVGFAIPPGSFTMQLEAVDHNDSTRLDSVEDVVSIPKYPFHKLATSDVELCSQITQAEPGPHGIFYKNTYDVVPNPRGVYGAGLPIIYYYVEVYNIPDSAADSLFTVEYEVRDSYGQVKKTHSVTRKKFGDSSVEVGAVNGSNLRTGAYTFIFTVIDSAANESSTASRRFFVYNPALGGPESPGNNLAGASMLSTVFATMNMEEVNTEFKEAHYIATSKETEEFDDLQSLPAKRQFLYDFWQKRNPDPALNTNSFRIEYLRRVAYANDHYRVGATAGWRTDRGRVYVMYGKPDQIDRHPNESNEKPYEIWYYNSIQGGVSFDFVDRTGFGDYTLVNSTARNEVHNDSWQQYLGSNN